MTRHIYVVALFICCSCSQPAAQRQPAAPASPQPPKWGIVIHTGAGNFTLTGITELGGAGGVIGLDAHGNLMMSFNTTGMGRGYVGADGKPTIMFTANDK